MGQHEQPRFGVAGWIDLTVEDAGNLKDFYQAVVHWKPQPLSMGDYSDYVMTHEATGDGVAGICHHRGVNVGIPPVWMVYFTVEDLAASLAAVDRMGGSVLHGPRKAGEGTFAVIRDPQGAVCALYQPGG